MKHRIGPCLLTLTWLALLLGSAWHSSHLLSLLILLIVLLILPLGYVLYKQRSEIIVDYQEILFTALGAFITFILHKETFFTPVTASALVGIIGYIIKKDRAVGIFAGSFAGMMGIMFSLPEALLVSVMVGIVYAVAYKAYPGFGGRLGTMGLTATLMGGIVFNQIHFDGQPLALNAYLGVIVFGIIGGMLTYLIQHSFKQSPVIASGVVGLSFGLIIPPLFIYGAIYAVVLFQNSFIGMASKERLASLYEALFASFIGSALFIVLYPYFGGLGGKLGTTAMISVLIIYQLKHKRFSLR